MDLIVKFDDVWKGDVACYSMSKVTDGLSCADIIMLLVAAEDESCLKTRSRLDIVPSVVVAKGSQLSQTPYLLKTSWSSYM